MTPRTFWLSVWLALAVSLASAQDAWQRSHEASIKQHRMRASPMLKNCYPNRCGRLAA
jgi:hypothetical protein